jgi:hypothetical protein
MIVGYTVEYRWVPGHEASPETKRSKSRKGSSHKTNLKEAK